jgi:hypothetical protein
MSLLVNNSSGLETPGFHFSIMDTSPINLGITITGIALIALGTKGLYDLEARALGGGLLNRLGVAVAAFTMFSDYDEMRGACYSFIVTGLALVTFSTLVSISYR